MDRYCIYNKYFVNKLTALSLYQKSSINSNIQLQNSSLAHKEQQVNVNFNLTQISSWCTSYNQYIQTKTKLCMKEISYACLKLEEKTTRSVEKNKNNFTSVIGDKCAMSIR